MPRAFLAVDLPPAVRESLRRAQERLRRTGADVAWSDPARLHLTLRFLGFLPGAARPGLESDLRARCAALAPFACDVAGVGVFGGRRPRVIWAGIAPVPAALLELQARVEGCVRAAGFPPEERPYTPHLTLGRVRSAGGLADLTPRLEAARATVFGGLPVASVVLYRSDAGPRGHEHRELCRVSLCEKECSDEPLGH